MLVLTRRTGEAVCVGNSVQVSVLGVSGGQVRLGIKAPPEIEVDRQEVRERKQRAERSGGNKKSGVS